MEAEFLGETTSIESVDPYMDATYPAEEAEPPESYKGERSECFNELAP